MKYFLIFLCICPILSAEVLVMLTTKYQPLIGKITVQIQPNEHVRITWDKNYCDFDNFGSVSGCTLEGPMIIDASLHLIEQSEKFNLFELTNFDQIRLAFSQQEFKILIMEKGNITQILPLHAEYIYLSTQDLPSMLHPNAERNHRFSSRSLQGFL